MAGDNVILGCEAVLPTPTTLSLIHPIRPNLLVENPGKVTVLTDTERPGPTDNPGHKPETVELGFEAVGDH
jgi:hypothetical protein